jgi:hypothetical protein
MPYCPKCGKEVKDDAVFCPYCGETMKPQENVVYRRSRDEKDEKDERNEKNEKNEKSEKNEGPGAMWGAVMGGLIVIWLGATFLLRTYDLFPASQWWNWFLMGLGIIIIVRGIGLYIQTSSWRASSGFLIGGAIVSLIGFASYYGVRDWWAIFLIIIGGWIVLNAVLNRNKNPKP